MKLPTPQPARHPAPTTKASALAYLLFERPDLDKAEEFLVDFGLIRAERTDMMLFMRGTGTALFCYAVRRADKPRFVGFGLEVDSLADLQALAALPGASAIEPIKWPGGGQQVRLVDPSGFEVHAVQGRSPAEPLPHRVALPLNTVDDNPRINATQRPPARAPDVIRLGHLVLELADYQATCAFYTQHFGFIPSDIQVLENGEPVVAFMRLDRGNQPADHHTLALAQGVAPIYSHSAYEVVDADAVGMGQVVLRERGWKHAWGIGRHILGSQIFDYWQDPWADKHEHYCDGDLFTANVPTGIHPVSRSAMSQWGQPMPATFTRPKFSLSFLLTVWKNIRRSPDLSLRKVIKLARIFA